MKYWCENNPVRTHFYDGWSILFPAWEKAFVYVASHYKEKVSDEDLKARIDQFCKQELAHANAHQAHNKAHDLGNMEARELRKARLVFRRPNHQMWLATMVSIEHMAACGARTFLRRYENQASKELNGVLWKLSTIKSFVGLGLELIFKSWIPYTEIFQKNFHPNNHDDSRWVAA